MRGWDSVLFGSSFAVMTPTSAFDLHRNACVFYGFARIDFKNSIAIDGFELITIKAVGEAEATAPGAASEFAQQRGVALVVVG